VAGYDKILRTLISQISADIEANAKSADYAYIPMQIRKIVDGSLQIVLCKPIDFVDMVATSYGAKITSLVTALAKEISPDSLTLADIERIRENELREALQFMRTQGARMANALDALEFAGFDPKPHLETK
jgi:hypothetical protein